MTPQVTDLEAEGPDADDPEAGLESGPDADHEAVARRIILDLLTGRARSRAELVDAVRRKGVPEEVAARLLSRFADVGLIDDAAFAREWVEARHRGRGLARRALVQELRRKGVDDAVAADAVARLAPLDEEERARELVRGRLRSMARLDEVTRVRRLTGMLARKGYPASVAWRVVREEVAGADELLDGSN